MLEEAKQSFKEALARSPGSRGEASPFFLALVHAGLGEVDPAFRWLENAYRERSGSVRYLKVERRLDPLRSDPRFAGLLNKVNLD